MSRAHGEGSILQRRDGRWQSSLMVGGTRRTVYGRSRTEAYRKLAELKRQAVANGALANPGQRTVGDLLNAWLDIAALTLRPATLDSYKRTCAAHILPALGAVRLSRLEPASVERLLVSIQAQGHQRTAMLVYAVLHRACSFAVRWRWLNENPCDRVQRPQYRARRKDVWSPEQLHTFLEGSREHWLFPLWHTLIVSGCRLGELLALRWPDVNFDTNCIKVARTLQRVAGQAVLGEPKTAAGQRVVVLPAQAMALLRQQRGRQVLAGQVGELVFPALSGRPLHHSTVEHALARECQRLGLPGLTPHGLRHLHASLLLAEGLPLPAVAARLGHAHAGITASVYAHSLASQDNAGAAAIAKVIEKGGQK